MMTLFATLTAQLHHAVQQLFPQVEKNLLQAIALEAPRDATHGDLATNAAMVFAKPLGTSPRAVAEQLLAALAQQPALAKAEIAGPGFINLTLQPAAVLAELGQIRADPAAYGRLALGAGRQAMVEFVSINPTGPIHVGHGRNAVFGEAIARLLHKAGYPVHREYLVNDAGNQIRVLVLSLYARYRELFGESGEIPADGYGGEYLIEIAKQLQARDGAKWLALRDEDTLVAELREFAVNACLELIKADITTLGIAFDRYFSEHAMHTQTQRMAEAVGLLRAKGLVYEGTLPPPKGKDIANYTPVELTLFKATAFGLPEDQAIYNRRGAPTYFGQDIAYHYDKLQRGFDLLVTVIGIDQAGAFKPLAKAIEALTGRADIYHPVAYEMVKVLRHGEPVKLSKRAGNIVLLSDVLAEVGADSFRFAMLGVKPTTPLVFDLAKAVEKNMENPVFYAQYAHARLASVARQAMQLGLPLPPTQPAFGDLDPAALTPAALAVARLLLIYPALIEQAARALEPHRLATYATQLATAVHGWYAAEKWLDEAAPAATTTRLQLAAAAKAILADSLGLCGVSAPESM
ncbi:MAG: arginine--tRNA ligase [Alphaproteobacteria bacterium]|nr:arginine--tRNA ligase [Alphaproteobacteria bacterium]